MRSCPHPAKYASIGTHIGYMEYRKIGMHAMRIQYALPGHFTSHTRTRRASMQGSSSRQRSRSVHWPLTRVKPALQVAHVVEEPEAQAWQFWALHAGTLEG